MRKIHENLNEFPELLNSCERYFRIFDEQNFNARELLIWFEETKIWQTMYENCCRKTGESSYLRCQKLAQVLEERNVYYNSNFKKRYEPKHSPGLITFAEMEKKHYVS